jgi:hypothetical protein
MSKATEHRLGPNRGASGGGLEYNSLRTTDILVRGDVRRLGCVSGAVRGRGNRSRRSEAGVSRSGGTRTTSRHLLSRFGRSPAHFMEPRS